MTIDIHVAGDPRGWEVSAEDMIYDWDIIKKMMDSEGYTLINLYEHQFKKDEICIEYGVIDTLEDFARIPLSELELVSKNDVTYFLLNAEQYLKVYLSSSKDSYRNDHNNSKDFTKIEYSQKLLYKNFIQLCQHLEIKFI